MTKALSEFITRVYPGLESRPLRECRLATPAEIIPVFCELLSQGLTLDNLPLSAEDYKRLANRKAARARTLVPGVEAKFSFGGAFILQHADRYGCNFSQVKIVVDNAKSSPTLKAFHVKVAQDTTHTHFDLELDLNKSDQAFTGKLNEVGFSEPLQNANLVFFFLQHILN